MATLHRHRGITRLEVVVVVLIGTLIVAMIVPASRHARTDASREVCRAHLAEIGKAMLLYAHDYAGKFPQPGGPHAVWGNMLRWDAPTRQMAFATAADGSGGKASISSAFYLLVKYAELHPKDCVCPGDVGATEFRLSDYSKDLTLTDVWDFGPQAPTHCSYAYQAPFGGYYLTTASDPRMAVAADRSPWFLSPGSEPVSPELFKPDPVGTRKPSETARWGNSPSHGRDGQNVLFVDGHVAFENRSDCGLDQDNIYRVSSVAGRGAPSGVVPTSSNYTPANRKDSVLLHDPGPFKSTAIRTAQMVSSKDLKQTAVIPTLDCPLPEHKSAIWCSTFQMAWDRFKTDIIGEPIRLIGAEDLADRLNKGAFPTTSIEPRSYYANAGFIKDGIGERIRRDMADRFPGEPVPDFDKGYTKLPKAAVAYSYLSVNVGFTYPYFVDEDPFTFTASDGRESKVSSFCTYARGGNTADVRGQVDVLYYEFGEAPNSDEFAVDLCVQTKPYQVILARVPRCETLRETHRMLQDRIAKFKDDPDYAVLSKLRPIDSMTVPDVLYKLTHYAGEVTNKPFANDKWPDYRFFEAIQQIDFSLSRTGVVVKSMAMFGGGTALRSPQQLAKPRHLRFDKPFLICVKKRQPEATPFFLMWVDNAELMQAAENAEVR
jgi:prepilin-type processing-associated H-X9-DG protein